jgi:hypothetical protein
MRITVEPAGFAQASKSTHKRIAVAATRAMRDTTPNAKAELRAQIVDAGLGERLAKTWQDSVYPRTGDSNEPAGFIQSKAAEIIESYEKGSTIVATGGRKFLAIPSGDCPRHRQGNAFTPEEVEERFGKKLIFISADDRGFRTPSARHNTAVGYLVLKGLVVRKATGRWRPASERERAGTTRNPRAVSSVIMFTLVRSVKKPKLLDLNGPAQRWANAWSDSFAQRLEAG